MLFSPPECSVVPKTCYPDRICSCSFLVWVFSRVASEHFWPKKKLECFSVTNQFIERLAEFVTLGINLHFKKYSQNHCICDSDLRQCCAHILFFFFNASLCIFLWCCPLSHGDSGNWYRVLFQRREERKTLMSLIIRIFVVTVFAPSVRLN